MAASKITVRFLFCDQGMGTLIMIYEGTGVSEKLTHLALVDLGSASKDKRFGKRALVSVIKALEAMDEPCLDLIIISHGDHDHWNLLENLQVGIDAYIVAKQLPSMKVKKMAYGGLAWSQKGLDAMKDFAKAYGVIDPLTKKKITPEHLSLDDCNYNEPTTATDFAKIAGVTFRLLASGIESASQGKVAKVGKGGKRRNVRNATSAVVVVDFDGPTVILPGDATAETVGWINTEVFDSWAEEKVNPITPCRALGAPHHGALATIAEDYEKFRRKRQRDPDLEPDLDIAKTFSAYISAEKVVASAGFESHHKHPQRSVMKELAVNAQDFEKHTWVWYHQDWEDNEGTTGIYTTVFDKKGNWGEPEVTMKATGEVFVTYHWTGADIPPYERFDRYAATPHEK
jgi:beta-lactamase superfamily II metal-dependent hydrolase